jgi:hypothetical protein
MTARPLDASAGPPAALTAFLRGIERRGAVFAQLATGSAVAGDAALAATMHAFRGVASGAPFTEWPRRFWALLLANPRLRTPAVQSAWPTGFEALAGLGVGPRAALLLRLVAGLPEADAAAVLGVARATYRLALQRALPRHDDGAPDATAWRALGDAAQAMVRQLPASRLEELVRQREAAVIGRGPPPAPRRPRARGAPRYRQACAAVAAFTVLALAATWWLPHRGAADPGFDGVRVEPLPPAERPVATYDQDAALLTHRDFELLVEGEGSAVVADPGFFAWYAAQRDAGRGPEDAEPLPIDDAIAPAMAGPETADVP